MRAGSLRERITIQRIAQTYKSASGHVSKEWEDFAEVWAEKRFTAATERASGEAEVSEVSVIWKIRPLDGVTTKMRVLHKERYYTITGIDDTMRLDRAYLLFAKETASADL